MRTAPEEFNLAANLHSQDPTNAEFIRSFRTQSFPGRRFVVLCESEMKKVSQRFRKGLLTARKKPVGDEKILTYHIEEIYGYRGRDPRVLYLSPWEFLMFWEVQQVGKPTVSTSDKISLSIWTGVEVLPGCQAQAGIHYVVNDAGLSDKHDYIVLPDAPATQQIRHEWVLRRANRPYVPQPESTPMPDNASSVEEKAKLFSIYLRPWTGSWEGMLGCTTYC